MTKTIFFMAIGMMTTLSIGGTVNSAHTDCYSSETARQIIQQKRVPALMLYHYGSREVLSKNVQADTVPQADWDTYIMGDRTRFRLKPFRRGLYGTEEAEDADRFGGSGLMVIQLKASCLKSDRVETLTRLAERPRFKRWYSSKNFSLSLQKWASTCFDQDGQPIHSQFELYEPQNDRETICEKTVDQYYRDSNLAFIQDGLITRSWAIRDRSCIEHIYGNDEYWAREFWVNSRIWTNTCDEWVNHRNRTKVWFDALSRADLSQAPRVSFAKVLLSVKPPRSSEDRITGETVEFAAQDFSQSLDSAYLRCTEEGSMKGFQLKLKRISEAIDNLQSRDVKNELDQLCH